MGYVENFFDVKKKQLAKLIESFNKQHPDIKLATVAEIGSAKDCLPEGQFEHMEINREDFVPALKFFMAEPDVVGCKSIVMFFNEIKEEGGNATSICPIPTVEPTNYDEAVEMAKRFNHVAKTISEFKQDENDNIPWIYRVLTNIEHEINGHFSNLYSIATRTLH